MSSLLVFMSSPAKSSWRRHVAAFVLAIVAGALTIAPALVARVRIGDAYRGIPFLYQNDEETYLARMRELSEGRLSVASPFFYEYKNASSLAWPVGEAPYALLHFLTRLPLETVLVLTKALFPAALFLLVYAFVWRLTGGEEKDRRWPALAAASVVTLAYDPIISLSGLELSVWSRPVNPIVGALALFVVLILLERLLTTKRALLALPIGVVVGLMVWYPFSWMIAAASIGSVWLVALITRNREAFRASSYALAAAVLGSLPYAIYVLTQTGAAEPGSSSAARFGVFFTHAPIVNKMLLVGTLFFLAGSWWMARRTSWKTLVAETWWLLCASMLLSGWLAFNHQVITGRNLWHHHFVQYTKPFVVIALAVFVWRAWPARLMGWAKVACAFVLAGSIVNGVLWAFSIDTTLDRFRFDQRYADPLGWLNENAEAPCVALVVERDEGLTERIPAYTPCDVYTTSWVFSGVPEERIKHNFFVRMRTLGLLPEHTRSWMEAHSYEVRSLFFRDWNDLFAKGTGDAWFMDTTETLSREYAEFYEREFYDELNRYRLDYVILEGETPFYVIEAMRLGESIQAGSFRIYRFRP